MAIARTGRLRRPENAGDFDFDMDKHLAAKKFSPEKPDAIKGRQITGAWLDELTDMKWGAMGVPKRLESSNELENWGSW
jgi:phage terminase large subunit-like protein